MRVRLWGLLLLCSTAFCGCALLGKNEPRVPRYFTPEFEGTKATQMAKSALRLRLGRVGAWSHVRERMVVRTEKQELLFSEEMRWTEPPELYLRRALSRALFEERDVTQAMSGQSVTLDVELIAFEELAASQRVRMQASFVLHDERTGLLEETVTVELPVVQGSDVEHQPAAVEALSRALQSGVQQIADRVVTKLNALSPPDGVPSP